jgi:hydrogenase maturation protease
MIMQEVRSLILGMGNTILSDDAIGILVKRYLEQHLPDECGIDLLETSWGGFRIIDLLRGYDYVIIIDSIKTENSHVGFIHHLKTNDLLPTLRLNSYHDINFITAIKLAESLNEKMPSDIDIFAIEVDDNRTIREHISSEIRKSIYDCSLEVLELLKEKKLIKDIPYLKNIDTDEELMLLYREEEVTN